MKYIVTGGAGFIGSHVVGALIDEGYDVHIVDNFATGKRENLHPSAILHEVDIRDVDALMEVSRDADGIFHLAALARIQPSFEAPEEYFAVNVVGTANVLAAAKSAGVRRVVYSASSSAYGSRDDDELPLGEELMISSQALHPYGSTKRMGEMLMKDMGTATGGPETVCLRYFNVYGPRQTTHVDGPYATVIGIFVGLAKEGKPLTMVPGGDQRRDFTYVDDVVRANLLAMHSEKVGEGEIINIGAGDNYSIWDVARLALGCDSATTPEKLLKDGRCTMLPSRKGEVFATLADTSRAKELLGWEQAMDFAEGIRKSADFLEEV